MIDQKIESREKKRYIIHLIKLFLFCSQSYMILHIPYPGSQAVKTCNGASLIMESHIPLRSNAMENNGFDDR